MDGTIIAGSQIGPIAVSGALVPQLTEISETAHFIEKKFSGVNSKKNGGPTSPKQPDLNGTLVTPGSIDADIYGNGTVGTLDINRISHTKGTVGSITRQDSGRLNVPILFNEVGPSNLSVEISDLFNRATRQFQIQVDRIYSAIAGNNSGSRMGTGKHVASESLDCHLELINHTANPLTVYHRSTDPNNPAAAEFQPLSVAPTNSSDENASKTKGPDVRRDGVKACHVYLKIPAAIANGSLSGRIVIQYRMSGKTTPGKVMQVYNLGDDL